MFKKSYYIIPIAMIKSILICDSRGYAFYSRIFDKNLTGYDSILFSGFISAIGTIGRELFKEEIATISFGYDSNAPNIVVLSKDFFGTDKRIYFVFLTQGDIDLKKVKDVCTNIYINNKDSLKNSKINKPLQETIDKIIDLNLLE